MSADGRCDLTRGVQRVGRATAAVTARLPGAGVSGAYTTIRTPPASVTPGHAVACPSVTMATTGSATPDDRATEAARATARGRSPAPANDWVAAIALDKVPGPPPWTRPSAVTSHTRSLALARDITLRATVLRRVSTGCPSTITDVLSELSSTMAIAAGRMSRAHHRPQRSTHRLAPRRARCRQSRARGSA